MKGKIFAGIMAAVMCCGMFTGCGGNLAADGSGGSNGGKKKAIAVYSTGEDYRNENARKMLTEHFPEYDITLTDIGTGTLAAKLAAEGKDSDIDIIMELETSYLVKCKDSLAALDSVDFSGFIEEFVPADKKYSPWLMNSAGIIINRKVLEEKGAAVPTSYDDLLKPEYKGLVSMPSPKSSGTGYMFLLNLVNERGEDAAFEYFDKLADNMSGAGFTTSGSGPVKALIQGEAGIGLGITYQAVNEINNGAELEVIYFKEGAPYNTYSAAVIAGKETDEDIMKVFNYIINEVSREDKRLYIPEKVFKEQESDMKNFPENITYGNMTGIDDVETKERLLDKWTH
ncbi:MAG: extracellular solute-binding protein [Oscillospiraceae bacterium]|nr:extracellular solute-binding protein [Oscillospiraceae bacterium]